MARQQNDMPAACTQPGLEPLSQSREVDYSTAISWGKSWKGLVFRVFESVLTGDKLHEIEWNWSFICLFSV